MLEKNLELVMRKEGSAAKKAIADALKKIEKAHGKGAVMRLGEKSEMPVEAISSGSIKIDRALGVGGYPKGRIIEVFGPESSGKTTVALHAIAEVQKNGGIAAFIDAEHALDPLYAQALGVKIDELYLSQPDTGEQALEISSELVSSSAVDLIVIDSVAALVPQKEIDGEMGDSHVGLQARLMSQGMRKLSGLINITKTTVIFINQLREKVGITFGNPEVAPGGRALKFYASIRLEVRRADKITIDNEQVGNLTKIKVLKNKVAPPFKMVEVDLMYGEGISKTGELLDLAVEEEIIQKSGAWFRMNEESLGQGKESVKKKLAEDTELFEQIKQKLLEPKAARDEGKEEEVIEKFGTEKLL